MIGFTAYAHLEWGEMLKKMGAKEVFGREIGFGEFAKKIESILKRIYPRKFFIRVITPNINITTPIIFSA